MVDVGLLERINKDEALARGHQPARQMPDADIVEIIEDLERWDLLQLDVVPLVLEAIEA